jgi:hypothetical protein
MAPPPERRTKIIAVIETNLPKNDVYLLLRILLSDFPKHSTALVGFFAQQVDINSIPQEGELIRSTELDAAISYAVKQHGHRASLGTDLSNLILRQNLIITIDDELVLRPEVQNAILEIGRVSADKKASKAARDQFLRLLAKQQLTPREIGPVKFHLLSEAIHKIALDTQRRSHADE